jgi:hypothetical protein
LAILPRLVVQELSTRRTRRKPRTKARTRRKELSQQEEVSQLKRARRDHATVVARLATISQIVHSRTKHAASAA